MIQEEAYFAAATSPFLPLHFSFSIGAPPAA
jgi:hypothetical protein